MQHNYLLTYCTFPRISVLEERIKDLLRQVKERDIEVAHSKIENQDLQMSIDHMNKQKLALEHVNKGLRENRVRL